MVPDADRLTPFERYGLLFFALVIAAYGALVVHRSVFQSRLKGDVHMLFGAGWEARQGGERLYTFTSINALHFHYPPVAAVLLVPFASPAPGPDTDLTPLGIKVGVWFLLNLGCILLGLHLLASALEAAEGTPPPVGGRRWFALRSVPFFACLPGIGSTLNQGQITPLLFLLVAGGIAATVRNRRFGSGLCFAAAGSIKLFPLFMALLPLWRRDLRAVAGGVVGLLLGLVLVPVLYFGPDRTAACYRELFEVLVGPALGMGGDQSRAAELLNTTAVHNQSLTGIVTGALHPDRATRPLKAEPLARGLILGLSALMTALTLFAFRRPPTDPAARARHTALFGGALAALMVLVCPVSHLHYVMLALPAVLALVAADRGAGVYPSPRLVAVLALHVLGVALAQMPGLGELKDQSVPALSLVLLWAVACRAGHRLGGARTEGSAELPPEPSTAGPALTAPATPS